jgi:hypothetical protein
MPYPGWEPAIPDSHAPARNPDHTLASNSRAGETGILCASSLRKRYAPRCRSQMAAYSAQRASVVREAHRLSAYHGQCGIYHTHGKAEQHDFGDDLPGAILFNTSNCRKQACNYTENNNVIRIDS